MRSNLDENHPLRKLFSALVEHTFQVELGICDPRLTTYLADMLADFLHMDRIYRMACIDGERIRELSRMEADAYLGPQVGEPDRTRLINRYIGDFTLFWTGVYPESLRFGGQDRLCLYLRQGKRSYGIAGELTDDEDDPPGYLLNRLGCEFEACVHGLHRVRECWQSPGDWSLPN